MKKLILLFLCCFTSQAFSQKLQFGGIVFKDVQIGEESNSIDKNGLYSQLLRARSSEENRKGIDFALELLRENNQENIHYREISIDGQKGYMLEVSMDEMKNRFKKFIEVNSIDDSPYFLQHFYTNVGVFRGAQQTTNGPFYRVSAGWKSDLFKNSQIEGRFRSLFGDAGNGFFALKLPAFSLAWSIKL